MRDTGRDFLIGLVTIAAMIGMVVLLIRFGELEFLQGDRYVVTLETDRSGGLRPGSPVELHGIPIGTVERIALGDDRDRPVIVTLRIRREVRVPQPMRLFVQASVLGGTSILELAPLSEADTHLPEDGSAIVQAPLRSRLVDDTIETLSAFATPLLEAAERFSRLSDTFVRVGESIESLIEGDANAAGSIPHVLTTLDETLAETRRTAALLSDWLADPALREGVERVVQRSDTVLTDAQTTMERYRELADGLSGRSEDVAAAMITVGDELGRTLSEISVLTRLASEGPGTVARLLNEPDLHLSLIDATVRLELTLREAQLLIEKARAEGVRLGF